MTTELAFLLSRKVKDGYLTLEARAIHLEDGKVRNIRSSLMEEDSGFADFVVSARANLDMGERTYGWKAEYQDTYTVDLQQAQAMAKHLTKVERGMAKLTERYGYADTFGAWMLRVADVLKIKQFMAWRSPPQSWGYDSGDYFVMQPTAAAYFFDEAERDFFKKDEG